MSTLTQIKPGALALASEAMNGTILAQNLIKQNQRDIVTSMNTLTSVTCETLGEAAWAAADWTEAQGKDQGHWTQYGAIASGTGTITSVAVPATIKGVQSTEKFRSGDFGKVANTKDFDKQIAQATPIRGEVGDAGVAVARPDAAKVGFDFTQKSAQPVSLPGGAPNPAHPFNQMTSGELKTAEGRIKDQRIQARKDGERWYGQTGTLASGLGTSIGRMCEGEGQVRGGIDGKEKEIQEGLKATTDIAARSAESARQNAANAHDAAQQNAKEASETLRILAQVSTQV